MGEGGSADRYQNVNPYTDTAQQAANQSFANTSDWANQGFNMAQGFLNNVPNVNAMNVNMPGTYDIGIEGLQNAFTGAANNFDPMSAINNIGNLNSLISPVAGVSEELVQNYLTQGERASQRGLENAAFAGRGLTGGSSGAQAAAMAEAGINPLLQAQGNIFNVANQNRMGLLGQSLGMLGQGNMARSQFGLQGAQGLLGAAGLGSQNFLGREGLALQAGGMNQNAQLQAQLANQASQLQRAGIAGNMFNTGIGGMTSSLGTMGQLGQRETVYEPTWWERVGAPLAGGAMDLAGLAINPFGGGLNALSSLFGGGGGGTQPYIPQNSPYQGNTNWAQAQNALRNRNFGKGSGAIGGGVPSWMTSFNR